jgi:DNA-binding transcriptional LysR family regulator
MSLSSLQLDAFAEVARLKSFSQAAQKLHVTQSALSQRILNLEEELGSSLFIRESSGVRLTDLGQRLQRYCHSRSLLEGEFMESLRTHETAGLTGLVRIGGFSTVNRSVLLPLIGEFLKAHPGVNIDVRTEELRNLPPRLFSGIYDLVLLNQPIAKREVENHLVGHELYVLVQSAKAGRRDIYLDNDEEDTTTYDFFKGQGKKDPVLKRNFLGDIDSIIDGVKLGLGRAVVPRHLIRGIKGIEPVKGYSTTKMPVHLSFYTQTYYTELQKEVIRFLQEGITARLAK